PAWTAPRMWRSISPEPAPSWSKTDAVRRGRPATSGGQSHSWVTPTTSGPAPMEKRSSVALGSREAMRIGTILPPWVPRGRASADLAERPDAPGAELRPHRPPRLHHRRDLQIRHEPPVRPHLRVTHVVAGHRPLPAALAALCHGGPEVSVGGSAPGGTGSPRRDMRTRMAPPDHAHERTAEQVRAGA